MAKDKSLKKDILEVLIKNNRAFARRVMAKPGRPAGSAIDSLATVALVFKACTKISDEHYIYDNDIITDAGGDACIDAIHFDAPNKKILIFDVKSGGGFGARDIAEVLRNVSSRIMDAQGSLVNVNAVMKAKITQARSFYLDHEWHIVIYFARPLHNNCLLSQRIVDLEDFKQKYSQTASYQCLCRAHFVQLVADKKPHVRYEHRIRFKQPDPIIQNVPRRDSKLPSVVIGTASLSELVSLQKKYGQSIFDDNVRLDLEDSSLTNEILATLNARPTDFYLYHNGFTISCEDIVRRGRDFSLVNPQILNGCQSLSAICNAADRSIIKSGKIEAATALCRIYCLQ
ncbi:MAG: AIPR family protein, partial [Nitrosotalea sp.]